MRADSKGNKPDWLKIRVRQNDNYETVEDVLTRNHLHTVCVEANCPNRLECYGKKTATFMILGRVCTRNCTFCNVTKGNVDPVDSEEPEAVGRAVEALGLRHAVVTSVTRDDLEDGGAEHFYRVIRAIRKRKPDTIIEVLIPDFQGKEAPLKRVMEAGPEIINHNVETVPSLYHRVRPMADYRRSLELLRRVKAAHPEIYTKSGMMAGLGEEEDQVLKTFSHLREAGCEILTIGQYLAPSPQHHPVVEYVHPRQFEQYEAAARRMGFLSVASAPFVRSSYNAAELLERIKK
jgi:lipoyl synthase